MKSFFNPSIIYVLLWILYLLQGLLYERGSIISQFILLVLLVWSARSCYVLNFKKKQSLPAFIKAVNVFLIVATIYGILLMSSGQNLYITEGNIKIVPNITYLKSIYMSMLPLYTFYYYSKNKVLKESYIVLFLLIFLVLTWVDFFQQQADLLAQAVAKGSKREEFTNNVGYSFLSIFPLLLFYYKKPLFQYILLLICMYGIIISMKRGAIVIAIMCFIYFIYISFKSSKKSVKLAVVSLTLVVVIAIFYIINDMLASSSYFVERLDDTIEGNSSSRDILYAKLWNIFVNEQNLLKILFGRGANATLVVGMNYAHNDWLELLTNQGVIGVVVYIYYFFALLNDAKRLRKMSPTHSNVLYMSLIILFMQTIFSMSYSSISIKLSLAIGFSLGCIEPKNLYSNLNTALKYNKYENMYNNTRLSR